MFDYNHFYNRNVNGNYLNCQRFSVTGKNSPKIVCNQDSQRTAKSSSNTTLYIVLGVLVFVLVVVIVLVVILVVHRTKKNEQYAIYMDETSTQRTEANAGTKKAQKQKKKKSADRESKKVYMIPYSELNMDELIGKGATSSVYKGRWKKHEVAIKSVTFLDSILTYS